MPRTPTVDVPDLTGRRALVTGASDGVGLELAVRLARAGAELLLPVRNPAKGVAAAERIRAAAPGASVAVGELDLSALSAVAAYAETLLHDGRPIHLLVDNAGVMTPPERRVSEDGFELQLATNHLGHFALAGRLLPLLRAGGARVCTQSSIAARSGTIPWDDLQWERTYDAGAAYAASKIAGSLFGVQLDRLSRARGWGIASTVAHPGIAATNLLAAQPELGRPDDTRAARFIRRLAAGPLPLAQSPADGALPALLALTSPEGGGFYGPRGPLHLAGAPGPQRPYRTFASVPDAERLWAVSEQLTGVRWPA